MLRNVFILFILFIFNANAEIWELTKNSGINFENANDLKKSEMIEIYVLDTDENNHRTNVISMLDNMGLIFNLKSENIGDNKDPEVFYNYIKNYIESKSDNMIKIINLSWKNSNNTFLDSYLINKKNTYYIIGAGNDNEKDNNKHCANYKNIICVGGTDNEDKKSNFSDWGANINILAPSGSYNDSLYLLNEIINILKNNNENKNYFYNYDKAEEKVNLYIKTEKPPYQLINEDEFLNNLEIIEVIEKYYKKLILGNEFNNMSIKEKYNILLNIYVSENNSDMKYNLDSNGLSGTSYAAPLVAGSLYYAFAKNLSKEGEKLTNEQVVESLKYTGVFIPTFSGLQVCNSVENIKNSREMCNSYYASNPRKVDLAAAIESVKNKEPIEIESIEAGNVDSPERWKVIKGESSGSYPLPSITKNVGVKHEIVIKENELLSANYLEIFSKGSIIKGDSNNDIYSIDVYGKLYNQGSILGCFSESCIQNNNYNSFIINAAEFINEGVYELNSNGTIHQNGRGKIIVKDSCNSVNANEGVIIVNYNENVCNLIADNIEINPKKSNETFNADIINKFNINGNHSNNNTVMILNKYNEDKLFYYNVNNFITDMLILNEKMNIENKFSVKSLFNNGSINLNMSIQNSRDENRNSMLLDNFGNRGNFTYEAAEPLLIKVSYLFYNNAELKTNINLISEKMFENIGKINIKNLTVSGSFINTSEINISENLTLKNIPSIKLSQIIGTGLNANKLIIDGTNLIIDTNFDVNDLDIINGGSVEVLSGSILNIRTLKNQNDLNAHLNKGLK